MKETEPFSIMIERLSRVYGTLPAKAATLAVNFSKERFREGAWLDKTKEPWPPRKRNQKGKRGNRQILVDSGRLKRSVRKGTVTPTYALIYAGGTGINYAQIHNEGGRVKGTVKVPAHTRKSYVRTRKGRSESVSSHPVRSHSRKINFIMPKRQFLGQSYTLERRIELMMSDEISRAIK